MKGNLADDREMSKSIVDRLDSSVTWSVHDEDLETLSHLEKLATCQIFLGHKTHSVIFGLATGTPLIAIAYHSKTEAFMGQFGLESHCVTDSNLSVDALKHIYTSVALDLDGLGDLQISTSERFSSKIRQDLEELLTV
jgi:polysaccharide pyruvyl transferase WcaK-like protein